MSRAWTQKELLTIKNEIDVIGIRGLERKLGIPASSIRRMVKSLGIERNKSLEPVTPFTPEMDNQLKQWVGKDGIPQHHIAERLGLSVQQVNRRVATLGIHKAGHQNFNRAWSQSDINLLAELYPKHYAWFVAKKLGRSVHAVRKMAEEQNISAFSR